MSSRRGRRCSCPARRATTGTWSRASAIPTTTPSTPPARRSPSSHDELWARDRDRARAHRPRRLLDGDGDELRDGPLGRTARRSPGSSPSAASSRSSRTGSRSLEDRRDTAGLHRPRQRRPDHGGRLRPPRPRAARGGGPRGHLPRVRRRPPDRSPAGPPPRPSGCLGRPVREHHGPKIESDWNQTAWLWTVRLIVRCRVS